MPHHPSIDGSQYANPFALSARFRQPDGPPKLQAQDGRSFFQSPPPPVTPNVSPMSDVTAPAPPSAVAPLNPRSQRAKEKQRAVSPERDTTLSYDQAYGGIEIPIGIGTRTSSTQGNYEHGFTVKPENTQLCIPQQSRTDPSLYKLPDVRNKTISAPLQPRVTDVRTHIERDPSYSSPTFDVHISLKIKMQPGDLR